MRLRYLTKAKRAENLENELCGQVRRKFGSFYLMWSWLALQMLWCSTSLIVTWSCFLEGIASQMEARQLNSTFFFLHTNPTSSSFLFSLSPPPSHFLFPIHSSEGVGPHLGSLAYQVEEGTNPTTPTPCKAEQDIPSLGMGSKKVVHAAGINPGTDQAA